MKSRALSAALSLVLPMSVTTPVTVLASPVSARPTLNWSGYALVGRAFSGVTGTFNVPVPARSAPCFEETAVWVGIDGLDNRDLLQAGVVESAFKVGSGPSSPEWTGPFVTCPGRVQVYAFWEDVPSGPVRAELPLKVGDEVSVSIFDMSSGWWVLAMHDITSGRSWLLSQPYAGPETSVEWIVEAPQVTGLITQPLPFGTVRFRDLAAQGQVHDLERVGVEPKRDFTSEPDPVGSEAQLVQTGFTVHWTP